MQKFLNIAKAIGQKQTIDTDEKLSTLKAHKNSVNQMLDMAITKTEMQKTEQKAMQDKIKYEEKRAKLKTDFIKSMVDQQQAGPVAVGGNLVEQFAPETAPDAQDLPMIDMNSKI